MHAEYREKEEEEKRNLGLSFFICNPYFLFSAFVNPSHNSLNLCLVSQN